MSLIFISLILFLAIMAVRFDYMSQDESMVIVSHIVRLKELTYKNISSYIKVFPSTSLLCTFRRSTLT